MKTLMRLIDAISLILQLTENQITGCLEISAELIVVSKLGETLRLLGTTEINKPDYFQNPKLGRNITQLDLLYKRKVLRELLMNILLPTIFQIISNLCLYSVTVGYLVYQQSRL